MKVLKRRVFIFIALIVLFLASFFLTIYTSKFGVSDSINNLFLPQDNLASGLASLQFYLLPFRMFEFLTGAILVMIPRYKIKSEVLNLSLNTICLFAIIYFSMTLSKTTEYLSTMNVIPCIAVGLLLYLTPSKHLSFFFNNKILRYFGKISYTLYLMHWIIIVMYKYLYGAEINALEQISLFVLMLIISALVYKFYETPLRYTKAKFAFKSNKSLISMVIINILIFYILTLKVTYGDGWLWRLEEGTLTFLENFEDPKDFHKNNWGGAGYKKAGWLCDLNHEKLEMDMFWMGDSHASHFKYGLDKILVQKYNKHIKYPYIISSLRLPDFICTARGEKSKRWFEGDLKEVKANPNTTVVLSHSWIGQIKLNKVWNEESKEFENLPPDSTSSWRIVAEKIIMFHNMIGLDRKIIVVGETPTIADDDLNYFEALLRPKYTVGIAKTTTSTFPNNKLKFNAFFEDYFKNIKNISFLNPAAAFCNDGKCIKQQNNTIYFTDSNHLSKDGSILLVKYLEDEFLSILNKNPN
jgi:hypothetical protein